jgi:ribonuclease BN (tRNA processing enzyme)
MLLAVAAATRPVSTSGQHHPPVLLDCGATSLTALKSLGLEPGEISTVLVSHLHGDHFGGLPFLILDAQFTRRTRPLTVAGPPGTAARLRQAMEVLFPGSASADRRFSLDITELVPGGTTTVAGLAVTNWPVSHPSGAPALALRLHLGGKTIAYTGDTAWTDDLVTAAADADLLIAEAYSFDKPIPTTFATPISPATPAISPAAGSCSPTCPLTCSPGLTSSASRSPTTD